MTEDPLKSVLYTSVSRVVYSDSGHHLREIVDYSRAWNASVGITGALVSSERRFVQFIEGPINAINDLLGHLKVDTRHTDVTIIEETVVAERRFGQWSLAYSGPDTFIDRDLLKLLQSSEDYSKVIIAAQLLSVLSTVADDSC